MDSVDISTVSEHKHLGLVISDNGSWEKHIYMITGKTYKRINILRTMSFMKNINKRGPSIEQWGTPALISRHWELELFITTLCFLFDKLSQNTNILD
jgi:hypothetical protein